AQGGVVGGVVDACRAGGERGEEPGGDVLDHRGGRRTSVPVGAAVLQGADPHTGAGAEHPGAGGGGVVGGVGMVCLVLADHGGVEQHLDRPGCRGGEVDPVVLGADQVGQPLPGVHDAAGQPTGVVHGDHVGLDDVALVERADQGAFRVVR